MNFLKQQKVAEGIKKKKAKTESVLEPWENRLANKHWLWAMDNAIRGLTRGGLAQFIPDHPAPKSLKHTERRYFELVQPAVGNRSPRRRSFIFDSATGQSRFELIEDWEDDVQVPRPTLHMHSDQGSIGWVGQQWLFLKAGLRGSGQEDDWHRRSNDAKLALVSSNLWLVVLQWCTVMNMLVGPWNGNAFYSYLKGALADDDNLPVMRHFYTLLYDDICADHGEFGVTFGSDEHFEHKFGQFRKLPLLQKKGSRVRMLRWFAWFRRARDYAPNLNELLVVLLTVGLKRKWWANVSDTPLFASRHLEDNDVGDGGLQHVMLESCDVVEPGAGDAGVAMALGHLKETVSGSSEELKRIRSKTKNGMHFAAQVIATKVQTCLFVMILEVFEPIVQWFDMDLTACKTKRGVQASRYTESLNGVEPMLDQIVAFMASPSFLQKLQFGEGYNDEEGGDSERAREDVNLATILSKLVWNTVSTYHTQSLSAQTLPKYFTVLTHPDEAVVRDALAKLSRWFDYLCRLEKQALTSTGAAKFLEGLLWPRLVWVRELLIQLAEVEFKEVPDYVHTDLLAYARAPAGTKHIEDVIGDVKRVASASPSGRIGDAMRWKACMTSGKLVESDRPPVTITSAAKAAASNHLASETFRSGDTCSLEPQVVETLSEDPASWPTPSPMARKLTPIAWMLAVQCQGEWDNIKNSWFSLLAQPQTILRKRGDDKCGMVVTTTPYGVFCRRMTLFREIAGDRRFFLAPTVCSGGGESNWYLVCIEEKKDWRVTQLEAMAPHQVPANIKDLLPGIAYKALDQNKSLMQIASMNGFKNMNTTFLKMLIADCRIKFGTGMYPGTVAAMVGALMKHVDPEVTDDAISEALQRRDHKQNAFEAYLENECLLQENLDLVGNLLEADDEEMSKEIFGKIEKRKQKEAIHEKKKSPKTPRGPEQEAPITGGSSSSASGGPPLAPAQPGGGSPAPSGSGGGDGDGAPLPDGGPRGGPVPLVPRRVQWEAGDVALADAREFAAPGVKLSKDIVRFMRWSANMPKKALPPTHCTKAWGAATRLNVGQALNFVLQTTWKWHTDCTGEPCPWDFAH